MCDHERWTSLVLALGLILALSAGAEAATNLYKIRTQGTATTNGLELIAFSKAACTALQGMQRQLGMMTQQRDETNDYTTVALQWGFIEPNNTDTLSPTVAGNAYNELLSAIGNGTPPIFQWCDRVLQ